MFAGKIPTTVEAVPLTRLQPAPWNPRTISDERFQNLCRSLEQDPEFLWLRPILATRDGTVFGGNMRLRAAQHLGWESVPAVLLDIPEQLAKERALRDNGSWGEWEERELQQLLDRLNQEPGEEDPADIPPLPEEPVSRPGDLWLLGDHRVLCGDSTDSLTLASLLGDERIACVWTDPPYGVNYVGGTKDRLTIKNDDADGLAPLLRDAFAALDQFLAPGAAIYVAHPAGPNSVVFGERFVGQGWRLHQTLVWVKEKLVPGHSDYHYKHEPILFGYKTAESGRRGRGSKGWYGGNDASSVFEFASARRNDEHPTAKPVGLVGAMVRNSSRTGDIVFDGFLGSGSALIACEQLGRRCYGIDLDPRYVDVAVQRWERFTGKKAGRAEAPDLLEAEARLAAMGLGRVVL